jgi:5' nucleotidase, deoxy (Pyrimidine), cytosolic type C protein (NT5C)
MARVFVDLDGVLADFDAGAKELLGTSAKDYQQVHGAAVMWKKIAAAPDFYGQLPPIEGALDMLEVIWQESPLTMILTGLPLGRWAEPQKRAWCAEHVGEHIPVICCMTRDKWQYCTPGDILIDDRIDAAVDWEGAAGRFIHHKDAETTLTALRAFLSVEGE